MTRMKKKVSAFLVLSMLFMFLAPVWAFDLTVNPNKESYESGESITVSTDVYEDSSGFSWSLTDWESNTTDLDGDQNSLTFNLPENNTGATATAVLEAVYGSESGSINIDIEPANTPSLAPEEEEPLKILELYPANGATGAALDTEIYIRFNKPAVFENIVPLPLNIEIGEYSYLLAPNEDHTKWSLDSGTVSLERGNEYNVIKPEFTSIIDENTGDLLESFPEWKFDTKQAEANSIRVDNVVANVAKGAKLQLAAQVLAKSGNVFTDSVTWSCYNTDAATISTEGLLTGIGDGLVEITVVAKNNPGIEKQFQIGIGTQTTPLQIINLCPANGESAEALYNSEKYIEFNKPAVLENLIPLPFNIQIGEQMGTLISNEDGCKWSLPAESLELEKGETYTASLPEFTMVKDADDGSTLASFPEWSFTTQDAGVVVPAYLEITDYPKRLNVGKSYPLKAVVKDKKGDVLEDFQVSWEVASISGGQATVDEAGNLTGTLPGTLRLVARAKGFPEVYDGNENKNNLEIRQNFDQHLLGIWATELTDRERHSSAAPLVGDDGTIYLSTGSGDYTVRAYDSNGNKIANFQEITNIGNPVLTNIGGREYLIASRDKKMCAFDPKTGRLEWESAELNYSLSTKAYVDLDGNIYAGCHDDGKVYAFNLKSDRYLWSYYTQIDNEGETDSLITIGQNNLIYVVSENKVFCLNSQGQLQWQYATPTLGKIPVGVELDSEGNGYFIENASESILDEFKEYNIYSLDSGGGLRWSINKKKSILSDLFVDEDDSLFVTINDQVNRTEKLTRLSGADGSVEKEFAVYDCDRFLRPGDGYIYTNKFIFNDNLEVVGYTDLEAVGYADDYYRDLPYMSYSQLALCSDGTLVRTVISEGIAVSLEKVSLVDSSNAVPTAVEVDESEITLIEGGTKDIFAQVKDSQGYLIPYLELTYVVADPTVATVDETGKITAIAEGTTTVDVKVQGYEGIYTTLTLHVLAQGEINRLYFVMHYSDSSYMNLEEEIESITCVVGEEQDIQFVVMDSNGQVIQDLPIKWTLSDSSVVQMYNYSGGVMGSVSKSIAVLNGLKEGTATLTAELEDYPGFQAEMQVEVKPASYEILWSMAIDGIWDDKIAYHCQAADGRLFIANHKKLKAVSSAGVLEWEQDIIDQYGFEPASPLVDESNVYVYDSSGFNLSLVALNQGDGSLRWSFTGGLGSITDIKIGSGKVYLLTDEGKVYCLDQDSGQSLWEAPLELETADATLGQSEDGALVYTLGHQVFLAGDDGSPSLLYTDDTGATLAIKETAPDGRIIMEKTKDGLYSIVSVDLSGEKNWEVSVETAVELSCDSSGVVYAVTRREVNPCVYFINEDGSLKAENVITAPKVSSPSKKVYCKPLIGTDGIVYLPITRLYAVNAADATLLWQAEFKDGFFKRIAKTATLDEENVLYLACDDAGFIAVKSKVAGLSDESGFYIDTSGISDLTNNTYRNLSFRVRNDNAEEKKIRVVVVLKETAADQTLSYSAATDVLAAGENKSYNCGVHIPQTGSHQVRITLLDQDNQVLTEKILTVM